MDTFVFRTTSTTLAGYMKIGDIAGESQYDPTISWGSGDGSGLGIEADPALDGMHVDPVIPGGTEFEDPSFGFWV